MCICDTTMHLDLISELVLAAFPLKLHYSIYAIQCGGTLTFL